MTQQSKPLAGLAALALAALALAAMPLVTLSIVASPLPAQAWEINYAQGTSNVSAGLHASEEFVQAPAFSFLQPLNSLTFVGDSRLMLLGLEDDGARILAGANAERERIRRTPYSFSWEGMALPEEGVMRLRYAWGEGAGGSVSQDGKTFSGGQLPSSVRGLEFELTTDALWLGPLPVNVGLGATHYTYQIASLTAGSPVTESSRSVVRAPLSVTTRLRVLPFVFLRPAVAYDLMSTLGMIFGTRGNTVHWDVAAEFSPLDFLPLTARVSGVSGSSEDSTLDTVTTTVGAGLRF